MKKRINGTIYDLTPSMTEDEADFSYADFSDLDLSESEFGYCVFESANFSEVNLREVSFYNCDMQDSTFENCDFFGAVFENSNLSRAAFISCNFDTTDFKKANLQSAEFRDCTFSGGRSDFFNSDLIETFFSDLEQAQENSYNLVIPEVFGEHSFGTMTGPLLKLNKVKLPMRAADFKRLYPVAFDKLKGDTGGRDFTQSLKDALFAKYETPFLWTVVKTEYNSTIQRHAITPDKLLIISIDPSEYAESIGVSLRPKHIELLEALNKSLNEQNDKHPKTNPPLLMFGWVRYHQDDQNKILMIEEIQSDLGIVRNSGEPADLNQIVQPETLQVEKDENAPTRIVLGRRPLSTRKMFNAQLEYVDASESDQKFLSDFLKPAAERFYTDAIGIVLQYASALGYTVEMISYADKIKHKAPSRVYSEIPREMGLTAKRYTEADMSVFVDPPRQRVSYYKPNPSKPPRYRR